VAIPATPATWSAAESVVTWLDVSLKQLLFIYWLRTVTVIGYRIQTKRQSLNRKRHTLSRHSVHLRAILNQNFHLQATNGYTQYSDDVIQKWVRLNIYNIQFQGAVRKIQSKRSSIISMDKSSSNYFKVPRGYTIIP